MDTLRRSGLAALNSRYIYGRLPLVHALVLLVEIMVLGRMAAKFDGYYKAKPLLTVMITNAILGGIADTTAQTITSFRLRRSIALAESQAKDQYISLEVSDPNASSGKSTTLPTVEFTPNTRDLPPPFDFERLTRFMAYGFIMSPLQYHWFALLGRTFSAPGLGAVIQRMLCDQLIFAPFGLGCFYTFMTVAEGGGAEAVVKKMQDIYLPTLKVNWCVWPVVQVVNFRFCPLQYQIPFVSSVGILWTAYLSVTNSAEDKALDE